MHCDNGDAGGVEEEEEKVETHADAFLRVAFVKCY